MPIFEQLEPRILLSADFIPLPVDTDTSTVLETVDEVSLDTDGSQSEQLTECTENNSETAESSPEIQGDESSGADDPDESTPPLADAVDSSSEHSATFAEIPQDDAKIREIVFINDDIDGFEELASDLADKENTEIFILNSSEDGLAQINTALAETDNISALHIFTHSNDSSFTIGSSWIDATTLEKNQDAIASWGDNLTDDGDILFYGCDLAASSAGEGLLQEIAELTGADVAASDDATGHRAQSGDWVLEYTIGSVETPVAVSSDLQSDWLHILAEETVVDQFGSVSYANNDGSVNWTGDWVEIGESDGAAAGNVLIEDGRLHIISADDNESTRGIVRIADLTGATSAILSLDYDSEDKGFLGVVSIQVRTDSGANWYGYDFFLDDTVGTVQFDLTPFISSTMELRFISSGFFAEPDGLSTAVSDFYVDNLRIDYTPDTWSTPLWLSTDGSVDSGGQAGLSSWNKADLIGLNNSNPLLGTDTSASFSMAAPLSIFSDGANVNGLHYVTTNMLIGASEFELKVGDILFTSENPDIIQSFGNIGVTRDDIVHFRPATAGDYSAGTFTVLFDNLVTDQKITGITLVEADVTVGDRDLQAGDLLFLQDGGEEESDIYHYATTDVNYNGGTTSGTVSILLEGDDLDVDIARELTGIDLAERDITIGNTQLSEGTLLLSVKDDDTINGTQVDKQDIFAFEVTTTSDPDGDVDDLGEATASIFFDGSDVAFNSNSERIDAISLTIQSEIPEPIFSGVSFDAEAQTITLTGTNLNYIGGIGENVKDRIDWSKIVWDINGDGATTPDITFASSNVSSAATSSTALTINLTAQKTNEITGSSGYAGDGGTDTLTLATGFSSNGSGEVATTDGLSDAPIQTITAPAGVNLSNTSIDENTDTTGGFLVGTLSTLDADSGDSHSYTITGGADSALFTIGGGSGNELLLDAGVLNYEDKSEYVVVITVTDSTGLTAEQSHTILVVNIDETPVISTNSLTVNEDQTVTLTSSDLAATDQETADAALIFTVETLTGGQFEHTDSLGAAITSFTQADLGAGKIIFVDDGNETAPSYSISVFDGALNSPGDPATITFSQTNDAPLFSNNSLTLSEGERVTLSGSDLTVSDVDSNPEDLVFTINSVSAGQFELSTDTDTAISSFTQEQLNLGLVQFIHNGGETAPAYSLTLEDAEHSIGPSVASIGFTSVNDQPVIQHNSLDILQGQTVPVTSIQLLATDPDDASTALSYSITSLVAGHFEVSGIESTGFTQDDINSGRITFVHDNSATPPAYDVEVMDDEGFSSAVSGASINFNTVNQTPNFDINNLVISEGATVTLSGIHFSATDSDHGPGSLIYTVSDVTHGQFEFTDNPDVAITSFSQSNINSGEVLFIHDGGEDAPSYTATVSDGTLTDSPDSSSLNFTNLNDAPVIGNNTLTIQESDTVVMTPAMLFATDVDDDDAILTFTVSDVAGGVFTTTTDTSTPLTSFSQAQIIAGEIQFIHDGGENAPGYKVAVADDSALSSAPQAAAITFIQVNDAPLLVNNSININEGGTVTLSAAHISATDPDSIGANLVFTATDISAGQFERTTLTGIEITSFTQAEVLAGEIVFIHDSSENSPAYKITVTDDGTPPQTTSPEDAGVVLNLINDAPELTVNTISLTEGGSVVLDSSMLAASDVDSSQPDLVFTVSELTAAVFVHDSAPATPVTTFTQAQVTNGEITILHDGSETVPSYSISVSDGNATTTPAAAAVGFTHINDAPTIANTAPHETYTEDTAKLLPGISVSDVDGGTMYEVTLDLSDDLAGSLSENTIGTATSVFAGGTLTISGSDINDVNSLLASTTFSPATDYSSDVTITIGATDGITQASGGTKTLHAIAVNDAPLATDLDQSGIYTEDTPYDLQNIIVSDVDIDETLSATMTLASPGNGTLTTGGGANFDTATGIWSITGTVAEVNNALSLVTFEPSENSFQDTSIAVQIEDGREDGATALSGTIDLSGTSVADAPVVTSVETPAATPSELIYITANAADGVEITHFQITDIANGELYLMDGLTPVSENDFITVADGGAGLIFTPSSEAQGSFKVQASEDGITIAPESDTTTSTITVAHSESVLPAVAEESESTEEFESTEDDKEESHETIEEANSIDETLDLFAGQETVTAESSQQPEDSSTAEEGDTESREKESENDTTEEDNADSATSYINARRISESGTDTGLAIAAAFEELSFDFSFAETTVNSFSSSSTPTQAMKIGSGSLTSADDESNPFSTSNYDLLDLEYRERSFEEYQSVRKSLESFREQTDQDAFIEKTVVGSAIAASTGLSAGYVIWLLRSGALLSSILSSLPAWQLADPLAVLAGAKGTEEDEDDSIESIIEQGTSQSSPGDNQFKSKGEAIADGSNTEDVA